MNRAWMCTELSTDLSGLRLVERPPRPCGRGQARVRVHAAALNFPDLLMAQGKYQLKPPLPFVAGMECAGEVVEVGAGVDTAGAGRRVCFSAHGGAFAESLVATAASLRPLPRGFSMAEGAAYGVTALTAWVALVRRGALQPGRDAAGARCQRWHRHRGGAAGPPPRRDGHRHRQFGAQAAGRARAWRASHRSSSAARPRA